MGRQRKLKDKEGTQEGWRLGETRACVRASEGVKWDQRQVGVVVPLKTGVPRGRRALLSHDQRSSVTVVFKDQLNCASLPTGVALGSFLLTAA